MIYDAGTLDWAYSGSDDNSLTGARAHEQFARWGNLFDLTPGRARKNVLIACILCQVDIISRQARGYVFPFNDEAEFSVCNWIDVLKLAVYEMGLDTRSKLIVAKLVYSKILKLNPRYQYCMENIVKIIAEDSAMIGGIDGIQTYINLMIMHQ